MNENILSRPRACNDGASALVPIAEVPTQAPLETSVTRAADLDGAYEWRVTWRLAMTQPSGTAGFTLRSTVHPTAAEARLAALSVAEAAVGGEVRLARRGTDGSACEVFTSAYELRRWLVGGGDLSRPINGRSHAAENRDAVALRMYCAFRDLLLEAATTGVIGRRECRDLRASVRSLLVPGF